MLISINVYKIYIVLVRLTCRPTMSWVVVLCDVYRFLRLAAHTRVSTLCRDVNGP